MSPGRDGKPPGPRDQQQTRKNAAPDRRPTSAFLRVRLAQAQRRYAKTEPDEVRRSLVTAVVLNVPAGAAATGATGAAIAPV